MLEKILPAQTHAKLRSFWTHENYHALGDPVTDLQRLVDSSPVIVDGGAYRGNETRDFLKAFDAPTIHAVEPNPSAVETMRDRIDSAHVSIHDVALGAEEGTTQLQVTENEVSSSVLNPNDLHQREGGIDISESITVPLRRLDSLIDEVDIIKLDLQGHELSALRGAEGVLDGTTVVLSEVQFQPLYDGAALYHEIDDMLRDSGFELRHVYNIHCRDGQMMWGDAMYLQQ